MPPPRSEMEMLWRAENSLFPPTVWKEPTSSSAGTNQIPTRGELQFHKLHKLMSETEKAETHRRKQDEARLNSWREWIQSLCVVASWLNKQQ
ncbi:hypothetical protein LEMLEM_LOCUS3039 [Lemmus lemmus]